MKTPIIIVILFSYITSAVSASEDSKLQELISVKSINSLSNEFFCSASLNQNLGVYQDAVIGLSKPTVNAETSKGIDRVVLKLSKHKLLLLSREEFDKIEFSLGFPLKILENNNNNLVAIFTSPNPTAVTTITLSYKTGIGSWTAVVSNMQTLLIKRVQNSPNINAMLLVCNDKKD